MNKLLTLKELLQKLLQWRLKNDKIVFTNGCFDVLHAGHIEVLKQAKALGNRLVVALNSDTSVKKLKGKQRPIINEKERAIMLSAIEYIDAVVIFEAETPLELIKQIKPNVLVKGGDWKREQIVGVDVVEQSAGEVLSIPLVKGLSTTNLIERIKQL